MANFEPIGEFPRWQIIYEVLTKAETGSIVSYDTLGEALGLDRDKDRHAIQMSVRRASQEHLVVDKRALEAVPNRGYRVVEAPEHMRLARQHQRKANRALAAGHAKAVHVDLSGMGPSERQAFEVVAQAFAAQMEFNRRFDVRQKRIEEAVSHATVKVSRSAEEIAELRARLERLESGSS